MKKYIFFIIKFDYFILKFKKLKSNFILKFKNLK